ncbi:hypothetical protein FAIPA1_380024 [Frankia sp. AiPs1]
MARQVRMRLVIGRVGLPLSLSTPDIPVLTCGFMSEKIFCVAIKIEYGLIMGSFRRTLSINCSPAAPPGRC